MALRKVAAPGQGGYIIVDDENALIYNHRQERTVLPGLSRRILDYLIDKPHRTVSTAELGLKTGFRKPRPPGSAPAMPGLDLREVVEPHGGTVQTAVRRLRDALRQHGIDATALIPTDYGRGIRLDAEVTVLSPEDFKALAAASPKVAMENAGPGRHADYTAQPGDPSGRLDFRHVDDLRSWIEARHLHPSGAGRPLAQALEVSVGFGTFFACGLMKAGWWTRTRGQRRPRQRWRSGVQQWKFHGFDEWGPSLDFSWDLAHSAAEADRHHFFGQFGDGDEADSIPVYLGRAAALDVQARIRDEKKHAWGGMPARIRCLLGHRSHFAASGLPADPAPSSFLALVAPEARPAASGADLSDWCLWLDPRNPEHKVEPLSTAETRRACGTANPLFSGYLWKCLTPKASYEQGNLKIDELFFVWQHANFADPDALEYTKAMLEYEERLMRRHIFQVTGKGQIVELAKSSNIVSGVPKWRQDDLNMIFDEVTALASGGGQDRAG